MSGELEKYLRANSDIIRILEIVRELDLKDSWLCAGRFVISSGINTILIRQLMLILYSLTKEYPMKNFRNREPFALYVSRI